MLQGTVFSEQILTRTEVARQLGVTERQLYEYLKLGMLFIPRFQRFKRSKYEKLTNWDVPHLQEIQHLVRKHGVAAAELHILEKVKGETVSESA